ncbi:hypothetical protein LCGC14_0313690 [marine sediment metagenome]|uniref:Uncharacterized protein n=1 Tax=marine sediment metagenome TaxID=412755 RepID=A0A0F9U468_9ZZZZ
MTRTQRAGWGTQGSGPAATEGLKETGAESLVVLTAAGGLGEAAQVLRYYAGTPAEELPMVYLRPYHGSIMETYPDGRVWGRMIAERYLDFVHGMPWENVPGWPAEKIGGVIGKNELTLWNEHGGHDDSEPDFWPNQGYWESEEGWRRIAAYELEIIKGFDEVLPDVDYVAWNESYGHQEDGPAVNPAYVRQYIGGDGNIYQERGRGFYALQPDIYGVVLNYQRPGKGIIKCGIHTYWQKFGYGIKPIASYYHAFRFARPPGYKDKTELWDEPPRDPGGLIHHIPTDMPIVITEFNSPDNSEPGQQPAYAADAVLFLTRILAEWGDRIEATNVFLHHSAGIDHGEYTHVGTEMARAWTAWLAAQEPLSEVVADPIPPEATMSWRTDAKAWLLTPAGRAWTQETGGKDAEMLEAAAMHAAAVGQIPASVELLQEAGTPVLHEFNLIVDLLANFADSS